MDENAPKRCVTSMASLHVIYVEDDEVAARRYQRALGDEGLRIVTACSLAEASDTLHGARFDAMLLDLNLPNGRGMNTLDTARAIFDGPIVVLTGIPDPDGDFARNAMSRGAHGWLTKGVDAKFIARLLRIVCAKALASGRLRVAGA